MSIQPATNENAPSAHGATNDKPLLFSGERVLGESPKAKSVTRSSLLFVVLRVLVDSLRRYLASDAGESAVELIRSLSTTNGRFCAYVRIAPTYSPSKPIKNS